MKIKIDSKTLEGLKDALKGTGKGAVRFKLVGFGWGGPKFDIVLDEQNHGDVVTEVGGVKFVAETEFAHLIKAPEIIKVGWDFKIKKGSCDC